MARAVILLTVIFCLFPIKEGDIPIFTNIPSCKLIYTKETEIKFTWDLQIVDATAYCDSGLTASGTYTKSYRTVAMASSIPFGTKIFIPTMGYYIVEDRGGAITEGHIDIYKNSKEACEVFGRQFIAVYIPRR